MEPVSRLPEQNKKLATAPESKIPLTNITMTKPCHVIRKMIHFQKVVPGTNRTSGFNKEEWMCELSTQDRVGSCISLHYFDKNIDIRDNLSYYYHRLLVIHQTFLKLKVWIRRFYRPMER